MLYYGDNLDVMRRHVRDESVDLVYLDPPFNSKATYNVLFEEQDGTGATAQIKAFGDSWHWDMAAAELFQETVEAGGKTADALLAFQKLLGHNDMLAYLTMMAPRLVECRRVLKPTGSIYLHCDPTASHYLKILMDAIFGARHYLNEIVWHYSLGGVGKRFYGRKHDVLLFYSKGKKYKFYPERVMVQRTEEVLRRLGTGKASATRATSEEKLPVDVWEIQALNAMAKERLGYPTQKPEALLEKVVLASSDEGDVVMDPFCGCGTTVVVAEKLKRRWIGIDVTFLAVNLMKTRLKDKFSGRVDYRVIGEPTTLEDAHALARQDKYQFQWWALGLLGARPSAGDERKGADAGIDGKLFFHDEGKGGKTKSIVFSVKGGQRVKVSEVRDLRGVVEREDAQIGVLVSIASPTSDMRKEAASAGFYKTPFGKFPRIQLLTIEEILSGKGVQYPGRGQSNSTFRKARREASLWDTLDWTEKD
jgi:site-specific DNA-methyltransferase (adenine-specific)